MKKFVSTIIAFSAVALVGCASDAPMTEEEQAASYGMTVERFREEKSAAARMNMSFDEHIKMIQMDSEMDHDMNMNN